MNFLSKLSKVLKKINLHLEDMGHIKIYNLYK